MADQLHARQTASASSALPSSSIADHRAVAVEHRVGDLVERVGRQAGVAHPRHPRMRREPLREFERVGLRALHPQRERAQSAQRKERLERARYRARSASAATRAARAVRANAVTSTPISRSEWPARYLVTECMTMSAPSSSGRTFSGVAKVASTRDDRSRLVCGLDQPRQIGHRQQRIRHRLEPQQPGAVERGQQRRRCRRCRPGVPSSGRVPARRRRSILRRSTPACGTTATVPVGWPSATAAIAAMPLANTSAEPPSSSPSADSSAARVSVGCSRE